MEVDVSLIFRSDKGVNSVKLRS